MKEQLKVYFVRVYFVHEMLTGPNILPVGSTDYVVCGIQPPDADTIRPLFEVTHMNVRLIFAEVSESDTPIAEFNAAKLRSR